jgi:hypothetical protein
MPDLDRLLTPPPASASSPAAPFGQPPASAFSLAAPPGSPLPHLNCIRGEKRGREREEEKRRKKLTEEKKGRKRRKKEEKKRKRKGKGKKKEKKYLFVENMISKLYCLLLFGKENKK